VTAARRAFAGSAPRCPPAIAIAGLLAFLMAAAPPSIAASASTPATDPAAFVAEFLLRAVELSERYPTGDPAGTTAWRGLVGQYLDVRFITRFVVGQVWQSATPDQRRQLLEIMEGRLAALCAARIREDEGARFEILEVVPVPAGDMLVATRLAANARSPIALSWRIHGGEAGWRILDIVSDGRSLMATKRAEYLAVFQRSAGNIETFIEALRRSEPRPEE